MAQKRKAKISDPTLKGSSIVHGQSASTQQQRHKQVVRGEPLHLDWRDGPNSDQILNALQLLLHTIAENGRTDMVTSHGLKGRMDAKRTGDRPPVHRGSRLEYIDADGNHNEAVRAWVYRLWTNVKSERNGYIWKVARVIKALALLVDSGVGPQMRRYTGFSLETDELKSHEALEILMDIALTIQVHPIALGVCSAGTGEFVLPSGHFLTMSVCENVFDYNDSGDSRAGLRKDKNDSNRTWPISPMVHSLKLCKASGWQSSDQARAVVVIEHRNLSNKMLQLASKGGIDWRGILFVFTSGFPSLSTRELLHMLGNDEALADVPFLFISDHDPHAMTIYFTVKMGARGTAWATLNTICPRLQWAGVTIDRFKNMAHEWADQEVERRLREYVILSRPAETLRATLKADEEAKMLAPLLRGRARLNKADKFRIEHIFRYEICSKENDALLYQDLLQMGMNEYGAVVALRSHAPGKKFSLAVLADPVRFGIERSILAILEEWNFVAPGGLATQNEAPLYSPGRLGFLSVAGDQSPRVGKSS